jgi:hypothetical protein
LSHRAVPEWRAPPRVRLRCAIRVLAGQPLGEAATGGERGLRILIVGICVLVKGQESRGGFLFSGQQHDRHHAHAEQSAAIAGDERSH